MTNQLLFGEHFEVLEENEKWYRVKLDHDDYECWVDKKQVALLDDDSGDERQYLLDEVSARVEQEDSTELTIVLGALIPAQNDGAFTVGSTKYHLDAEVSDYDEGTLDNAAEYAHLYRNTPYLWGGRTPFGIDCSGFTQMVYRMCGVALSRDSHEQSEEGQRLDVLEEAEEGDLAFFHNKEGRITHVGIILDGESGDLNIIHASGKVRIDKLDEKGIYNIDNQDYSHSISHVCSYDL